MPGGKSRKSGSVSKQLIDRLSSGGESVKKQTTKKVVGGFFDHGKSVPKDTPTESDQA